ncbi:MAG: polymerase sigma-70 factor, subfamily [Chloroflexota bacterium]|nr:polymerase sigma-70 factor, subfamily [Chloroflexota bacterium]
MKADFDALYRVSYPRVFRTLLGLLRDRAAAEDCAQEAFVKAFDSWADWKQDAPAEAWVHRIAVNVAISHRRRERLREVGEVVRRLGRPTEEDPTEVGVGPDVVRELRALPTKQAAAIILRHLHGYSNREIAASLAVPERTVASRLAAAKKTLRLALGADFGHGMGTSEDPGVSPGE